MSSADGKTIREQLRHSIGFDVLERNRLREERMITGGRDRAEKRREQNNLSNTTAGFSTAQDNIEKTQKALEQFLVERLPVSQGGLKKGGAKYAWESSLKVQLKQEEMLKVKGIVDGITPHRTADMSVRLCMDAAAKKWSLNQTLPILGKMFACLQFEQTMMSDDKGRRVLKRLHMSATEKTRDYERRSDVVWRVASELGFDRNFWEDNEQYMMRDMGSILLSAVLRGTNLVEVTEPVKMKVEDKFPQRYVVLTDETAEAIASKNIILDGLTPMFGAMLVEPVDWGLDSIGAYRLPRLAAMLPMIKHMSKTQERLVDAAMRNGELDKPLEALNTLQRVPLVINPYTLAAVEYIRDNELGRQFSKFPRIDPTMVKKMKRLPKDEYNSLPVKERRILNNEYKINYKLKNEIKANIAQMTYMVGEAKELLGEDAFFLPHQFDTRGRIYHATDFGFHKTDYIRSLFLFKEAVPIGDNQNFLAYQLANTWGKIVIDGVRKKSLLAKRQWVNANQDAIYKAGCNFKESIDFIMQAEEPMQFLAACHEYAKYCDFVYENGEDKAGQFMSNLPYAADATQSGIQHYAAALRSYKDAKLVNLCMPEDFDNWEEEEPQDFYLVCLEKAKELIVDDYKFMSNYLADNPCTQEEQEEIDEYEEQLLTDGLTKEERKELKEAFRETDVFYKYNMRRKVVAAMQVLGWGDGYNRSVIKRNCMTYCYGSRDYGFAEQIRSDTMKDLSMRVRDAKDSLTVHPFGNDDGYYAATYLATKHLEAIKSVISSAAGGMDFIQDCTELLAKDNQDLIFKTPLNFPMVQNYHDSKKVVQRVFLFDRETEQRKPKAESSFTRKTDKVNVVKSRNASCPNIIHSMDATHLMMTVLKCRSQNLVDLMVVHDSFATQIGNAEKMSIAIRQSFFDLYNSYELYENLQMQVYHLLEDSMQTLPSIPKLKADEDRYDVQEVLYAPNAFS